MNTYGTDFFSLKSRPYKASTPFRDHIRNRLFTLQNYNKFYFAELYFKKIIDKTIKVLYLCSRFERKHINKALLEELRDEVVVANFATTTKHGAISGENLDKMIILSLLV